ncbi:MAG: MarR family transcriptional regulator [Polyangiaceae bacterium]
MASPPRLFFLLARAQRAVATFANARAVAELGVTSTQLGALYLVARSPGVSMSEVAKELDVRKSAMSGVVGRLEDAGLLRKEPDADDARASRLFLTPKGVSVKDASIPLVRNLTRRMTEGLDDAEVHVVARFLGDLVERFPSAPAPKSREADGRSRA